MQLSVYHIFPYINAAFVLPLNIYILSIIVRSPKKNLGGYIYILIIGFAINTTHVIFDVIAIPTTLTRECYLIIYPSTFTHGFASIGSICNKIMVTFFIASLEMEVLRIFYRYELTCWPLLFDKLNKYPYSICWVVFPLASTAMIVYLVLEYSQSNNNLNFAISLNATSLELFGVPGDQIQFFGMLYYYKSQMVQKSFIALAIFSALLILFLVFFIYAAVSMSKTMRSTTIHSSAQQDANRQIFKAMLIQTIVPTSTINVPILILMAAPATCTPIWSDGNIFIMLILAYPILDPLILLYFVKEYRRTFFKDMSRVFDKKCLVETLTPSQTASRTYNSRTNIY